MSVNQKLKIRKRIVFKRRLSWLNSSIQFSLFAYLILKQMHVYVCMYKYQQLLLCWDYAIRLLENGS